MKIRLYCPANLASGVNVDLPKPQKHYLKKVLRCQKGDELFLFNPQNGEFTAEYDDLVAVKEQTIAPYAEGELTLIFAPIKFGKIDLLAEKATELGVTVLQPVQTKYTQIARINYERMAANATEAAEQTGRISVPEVKEIMGLSEFLSGWDKTKKIIFCDETGGIPILQGMAQKPAAILIGPEGGFAPEETKLLHSKDFIIPVSLGKRILRAETAAIAALGIYQAANGAGQ